MPAKNNMGRIIIDVKSFETDTCSIKNILNRVKHLGGTSILSNLVEYKDKRLTPVVNSRPDDTIITCKTSWSEIENLLV